MAAGRIDTMGDILRRVMSLLSEAKLVNDRDLPWILSLEQQVVEKLTDPMARMQAAGLLPAGQGQGMPQQGMQGMGAPGGMPQQAPAPVSASFQGAGGVRGVPTGGPNPDELRRILQSNQ